MQTITFSEQAFDTSNPVYLCKENTVSFSGQIVSDSDNPTSPVLSFDQQFIGPVSWTFSDPVSHVAFDAGVFNQVGSTTINIYDKTGALLKTMQNTATGLQHFDYVHAGIARVEVVNTSGDDSGFAVDNVAFTNDPPKVLASGNQDIDGVLWGYKWDHRDLTVSMPTSDSEYLQNGYQQIVGFRPLDNHQVTEVNNILASYEAVCGIKFSLTAAPNADIRLAEAQQIDYSDGQGLHIPGNAPGTAEAMAPDPAHATVSWGDCWFSYGENPPGNNNSDPILGNFIYTAAFMHELGHALGLKHGHAEQTEHGYTFPTLPADHDSQEYSVMTYDTYPGTQGPATEYPQSPMQDDIAALQYMYGADYHTNAHNTVYSWDPATGQESINGAAQMAPASNCVFLTIWDGGGTDTYDLSDYTNRVTIDLRPGDWTNTSRQQLANLGDGHLARGNIANALLYQGNDASLIENAKGGTAGDHILGNDAANRLTGGAGADTINGLAGNDFLVGGSGADTMTGGGGRDTFVYTAVGQSTGVGCDVINGFNAAADFVQLWFTLAGVDAAVTHGTLTTGDFDDDLTAAVGAAQLESHHAVLFTANAGSLKGVTFLIVDANGTAGYQSHQDLVMLLDHPANLASFSAANFS